MTSETVNASGETSLLASDSSPVSNPSKVVQPDGQRSKLPVRLASIVGVAIAFALVLVWFPKTWNMWNMPIQAVDAPSHYYFIRKLLKNGLSVAFELNPNDSFYPPLFHILVYALIKLAGLFGISVNIFTGLNLVWLFTSGLVFPAGMLLWCSYFFSDLPRPYQATLSFIVPLLSVISAAHPYWLLNAGPLMAYGLATSLLPFSLYVGLRLIDILIDQEKRNRQNVICWVLVNLILGILLFFAHPRIAFTYLVFMGFFILFKLPVKFLLSVLGFICISIILFYGYMTYRDHGKDYLHPSTWFHTFQPTRSLDSAVGIVLSDFIPGIPGVLLGLCIIVAIIASLFMSGRRFKDGLSLVCSFLLTGLIFICSASVKGAFANIITAAWYRGETRPLTMIPLATIPLLSFGSRCLILYSSQFDRHKAQEKEQANAAGNANFVTNTIFKSIAIGHIGLLFLSILLVLTLFACLLNPVRTDQSSLAEANTSLVKADNREQLTWSKYYLLTRVKDAVEKEAVIISDPLNGSMYGMTLYGLNMLYPVYNPMDSKNGRIFSQVEHAFASGDSQRLLATVCTVKSTYTGHKSHDSTGPKDVYFLSMGDQSPSLELFTYKDQYLPFHNLELINHYEQQGTMKRVEDFGYLEPQSSGWALYKFDCHVIQ